MISFNPYIFKVRNDFEDENPYLCECGTFLNLRARVKQLNDSGRLMYEAKRHFAQSQCLDSRMIDNDEFNDVSDDDFDAIDALNATDSLNQKLDAVKREQNAKNSDNSDSDSKSINDVEKVAKNASDSVSAPNS